MRRVVGVVLVIAACGDNRAIVADASVDGSPDAAICASLVCDDGNACTMDVCDGVDGCRHVSLDRCAEPACSLGACAGADTDGDGLSDAWEAQGYVDLDCDGGFRADIDLDLPGADVNVPNVYVEADFMMKPGAGNPCGGPSDCTVAGETCVGNVCTHTHAPDPAGLQAVVDAFVAKGLRLHIDPIHDAIPEAEVVTFGGSDDPACAGADARRFVDLKAAHFDPRRAAVYRYAIFAHHHTCTNNGASCSACPDDPLTNTKPSFGSAGIAELPGNDFIVALGQRNFGLGLPPTIESEAGVFMHELGHTLDLRHGGHESLPDLKPNYMSVMGQFVFIGVPFTATPGAIGPVIGHRIDYSDQELPALDENALVETAGIGASTTDVTIFLDGQGEVELGAASGPVDWDGSGTIDPAPVAVDINSDGVRLFMTGWRDWPTQTCTTDDDCPLRPSTRTRARIPCIQQRCATLRLAFQCAANAVRPAHSVCR